MCPVLRPVSILITALWLQLCDLLATVHIIQMGGSEANWLIGVHPDAMRLVTCKIIVVPLIIWLITTPQGCNVLFWVNIIYGLVVLYSLAGMTIS